MFIAILLSKKEYGIDVRKINDETLDLFMQGFHQNEFGYVNAMQNALTWGLAKESFLNVSATRRIDIFQEGDNLCVGEKVQVRLVADPMKREEMLRAQIYDDIIGISKAKDKLVRAKDSEKPDLKETLKELREKLQEKVQELAALEGRLPAPKVSEDLDREFPPLATISTTYTFSNTDPRMSVGLPLIDRNPPVADRKRQAEIDQDPIRQRMLARLQVDDRTLWQKFKDIISDIGEKLGLSEPLKPRGPEKSRPGGP